MFPNLAQKTNSTGVEDCFIVTSSQHLCEEETFQLWKINGDVEKQAVCVSCSLEPALLR